MPHLVENPSSQTSRTLLRKFSWEDDYYESIQEPQVIRPTEPLKFEKPAPENSVREPGRSNNGGAFKIRRKPININFNGHYSRDSDSVGSGSSFVSGASSPPMSISSRSSSVSPPPPPKRAPPSPPPSPPLRPRNNPMLPPIQCVSKSPLILPFNLDTKPAKRGHSPPSPRKIVTRDSVAPPRGGRISASGPQSPPLRYMNALDQFMLQSNRSSMSLPRPPVPRKDSFASESPNSARRYTAMLDLGRTRQAPNAPTTLRTEENLSRPTKTGDRRKNSVAGFSLPALFKTTPITRPTPPRYRQSSLPIPPVERKPSPPTPTTPVIQYRARASPDPDYRGGYESDENVFPLKVERINSEPTPSYRPPLSPGSPRQNKPQRPRISTNFDTVKPLNIQCIPKPVEIQPVAKPVKVHFVDEGLTSAEVQSEELTDIVDLYLEEVVSDAKSRGVMSSGLEEFLKSPTIMGEWHKVDIVYDAGIVGLKSKRDRSVSIVRQALRN